MASGLVQAAQKKSFLREVAGEGLLLLRQCNMACDVCLCLPARQHACKAACLQGSMPAAARV
jgi:hypothetical protein